MAIETNSDLGKAWAKLGEKQKTFVIALLEMGTNDHTAALRAAGYTGTPGSLRVAAHHLYHDPNVQQALHCMCMERLSAGKPMLTSQLLHLALNAAKESDRLKAIELAMNRIGMHQVTEHHVTTRDVSTTREALIAELHVLLNKHPEMQTVLPPAAQRLLGNVVVSNVV